MAKDRGERVRIENPPTGGQDSTSVERANRFVRNGRAVRTGAATIRFLDGPTQEAVRRSAEMRLHAGMTGCGYDQIKRVFGIAEMRNLPVFHPERLLHGRPRNRDEGGGE